VETMEGSNHGQVEVKPWLTMLAIGFVSAFLCWFVLWLGPATSGQGRRKQMDFGTCAWCRTKRNEKLECPNCGCDPYEAMVANETYAAVLAETKAKS